MNPEVNGIREKVFLIVYITAFIVGTLALLFVPSEYKTVRLVAICMAYFTALPLIVIKLLMICHKKGWLKLE